MSRVNTIVGAGLIAGALLMGSLGAATAGDGRGQPNDHASCMGQERAPYTSDGGDWDHGTFGENQSAFVI